MRSLFHAATLLSLILIVIILGGGGSHANAADNIFFSEYVEGTEGSGIFNKALEIYNPTGLAVDAQVEEIRIEIYANGSATPTGSILYGVGSSFFLSPGDVFVLVQATADTAFVNRADDTVFFLFDVDGNDAIVLRRAGEIVDVIGQIGVDPGPGGWGSGDTSTANHTLRRRGSVCKGDTDGSDAFDPAAEWNGFPIDTYDGLGLHDTDCAPTATEPTTWGNVKGLYKP